MPESASSFLSAWSSFYIMMGSAAATLTGLMFVVITLVRGLERMEGARDGIENFSSPTVMHFGAALLYSAVLVAPWRSLLVPAALLAAAGLYGVISVLRVMFRARRMRQRYVPDIEDWIWYWVIPFVAYVALLAGAIALPFAPAKALYVLAGGVVLLIFAGIRNSWDVVTFIATGRADAD